MAKASLYEILGLPETCSAEQVAEACRRQFERIDAEAGDDAGNRRAFVRYAQEVLGDPARRRAYDRQLAGAAAAAAPTPVAEAASPWPLRLLLVLLVAGGVAGWKRWGGEPARAAPPPVAVAAVADPRPAAEVDATPIPTEDPGPAVRPQAIADPAAAAATPNEAATAGGGSRYSVNVNLPNAEMFKKLVWSVHAVAGATGFGTGIVIDGERLLTNCHVLVGNVGKGPIHAIHSVTRERAAITRVAWLPNEDACLIEVPGLGGQAVALGSSGNLKFGNKLHNVGFPSGSLVASEGVFVAWHDRHGQPFVVSNNYCAPGVSGGPLVDDGGRLVGLTTGGTKDRSFCISLTVETAQRLLAHEMVPIEEFPSRYASNVTRRVQ